MKIRPPSEFVLAGVDVKDGDILTILDEGKYGTLPQQPDKEVLTFKIKLLNGNERKLTMNATSQKELIKAWGEDSKNWVGKKVKAEVVKQQVFDKRKDVIYLSPAEGIAPEPPEEPVE